MPVPSLVTDLSTTAASNSPAGSDNVFPDLDNYLRAMSAFIASIRDNSGNGWVSPYLPITGYSGSVLISTTTSNLGKVRILSGSSQNIEMTSSDTNAAIKTGCISVSRYTNTDAPFTLIRGVSGVSTNTVYVGGGASASAPATDITFYTGALSAVGGNGTERMRIDENGNVGIGTATPSVPLVVQATAGPTASFASTNDTSGPRVTFSHESPTPAANDVIAEIRFNGRDSALSADIFSAIYAEAKSITPAAQSGQLRVINYIAGTATSVFVLDAEGNAQLPAGALVVDAPTPASISGAATLSNANLQTKIINTTGTSYTLTMPLGTTLETLVPWFTTNLGFDFSVINTASGTITMAANTGVTTLGGLTIATGTSAQFRIRRTAANTFVLYRLG